MIHAYRCLFLIFALALAAGTSSAQVQTGTPPFSSLAGGPDAINLANLNSHQSFPVFHKAGRSLPFNLDLTHDNTFWQPVTSNGITTWAPVSTFGWSGSALNVGSMGYSLAYDIALDGSFGIVEYFNFGYYDGFGTSHPWPSSGAGCQSTAVDVACVQWNYYYAGFVNFPFTDTTKDSSGYTLTADACKFETQQGYPTTCVATSNLTSADGNSILPQNLVPISSAVKAGSVIDRNGNEITVDASGNYTDTLGTIALRTAGGNPNPYTLTYTSPAGTSATVTVTFKTYPVRTHFACSNIADYGVNGAINNSLVDKITLPDGTFYQFLYEQTPGFSADVTGRLASVTLPTGGTITYAYSGGGTGVNGITCADGSAATLTRTTPDGTWTYARTLGTGAASTTTIIDPQNNQTVIQFQGNYEAQRQVYQGSATPANLLQTTTTCYNGNTTNCPGTAIPLPINKKAIITTLPGGLQSEHDDLRNTYGFPSESDDYDYGQGARGPLLKKTLITYAALGTNIHAFRQSVTVQDGNGNTMSQTSFSGYDETPVVPLSGTPQHINPGSGAIRGNLTTVSETVGGSTLTKKYTYYDTGNVQKQTDVNGAITTFNYPDAISTCGNSSPTSVSEPLNMSKSMTWNCTGGVQTSTADENGQTKTIAYTDSYFWRPASAKDETGAVSTVCYGLSTSSTCAVNPNQTESTLNFNSNNSTVDKLTTTDGLGRRIVQQIRQSPGAGNFDSVESDYDSLGRPQRRTLPYSGTAGQTNSTGPATTTTYDAMGRVLTVTDAGGGKISYTYAQNDVLIVAGPAPTGENAKQRQLEYDGLGRLTSVCEITSGAGSGSCGQTTSKTGYWTKYTYDALGNLTGVTQNAQAATAAQQTRSYTYDGLSRLTSETNPESNKTTYTFDADTTCGTSSGDQVKRVDAVGNTSCYIYDTLHRITSITYSGPYATNTPTKYFVYDAAVIAPGTQYAHTMANAKSRLAEAYTATCLTCAKTTDEGFSYTARGEVTYLFQQPPNGSNFSSFLNPSAGYWENGVPSGLTGFLSSTSYGLDGEGRVNSASDSNYGYSYITAAAYNPAGLVTLITYGSATGAISSSFGYDPYTSKMRIYQFNIGNNSFTGSLSWNPNGTLLSHSIIDAFNNGNTQNCVYSYDDLTRIQSANCSPPGSSTPSVWQQSFNYDAFGNISKSGSMGFQPTYTDLSGHTNNKFTSVPGCTVSYDSNGNVLNDCTHTYTWDAEGRPVMIDNVVLTYDALGRMVHQNRSGAYAQILYAPTGGKLSIVTFSGSGSATEKALFPLPGKSTVVVNRPAGNHPTYSHSDWLGSIRFSSVPGTAATAGTGFVSISGTCATGCAGAISVTVNGFTASASYAYPMTLLAVAGALSKALNGSGSPVTPSNRCTLRPPYNPCPVRMFSIALGAAANYPFSVTASGPLVVTPSGSTLTGGVDAVQPSPYFDMAYAPFGETYAQTGTVDPSFAGLRQDTVAGLYDAENREYNNQGRWPSPDPAGIAAADVKDPQTQNRYAYVTNNPLNKVDRLGLWGDDGGGGGCDWWDPFCGGSPFPGGGGGYGGGPIGGPSETPKTTLQLITPDFFGDPGVVDCGQALADLTRSTAKLTARLADAARHGGGNAGHIKAIKQAANTVKDDLDRVERHCGSAIRLAAEIALAILAAQAALDAAAAVVAAAAA